MKERVFMVQQELKQQPSVGNETRARRVDASAAVSASTGFWSQLTARVRAWFEVPFGFEDEQGFHYGQQPAPKLASEAMASRARVLTDRADQMMRHSVVLPVASPAESRAQPGQPAGLPKKDESVPA